MMVSGSPNLEKMAIKYPKNTRKLKSIEGLIGVEKACEKPLK